MIVCVRRPETASAAATRKSPPHLIYAILPLSTQSRKQATSCSSAKDFLLQRRVISDAARRLWDRTEPVRLRVRRLQAPGRDPGRGGVSLRCAAGERSGVAVKCLDCGGSLRARHPLTQIIQDERPLAELLLQRRHVFYCIRIETSQSKLRA